MGGRFLLQLSGADQTFAHNYVRLTTSKELELDLLI